MSNTVTMKDIAQKLNVSINAVSIALNDKEGVSTELRMQILEAATEMNYPFKKLNVKDTLKNKTLVIMIEDKKRDDLHYYLDLLKYIIEEAHIFGYRIFTEFYNFKNFVTPKCISEYHVAGIIVLGKISDEIIYALRLYNQKIICVNHSIPYFNVDTIITNNFLGGYVSCEYLIKKGYRNMVLSVK